MNITVGDNVRSADIEQFIIVRIAAENTYKRLNKGFVYLINKVLENICCNLCTVTGSSAVKLNRHITIIVCCSGGITEYCILKSLGHIGIFHSTLSVARFFKAKIFDARKSRKKSVTLYINGHFKIAGGDILILVLLLGFLGEKSLLVNSHLCLIVTVGNNSFKVG